MIQKHQLTIRFSNILVAGVLVDAQRLVITILVGQCLTPRLSDSPACSGTLIHSVRKTLLGDKLSNNRTRIRFDVSHDNILFSKDNESASTKRRFLVSHAVTSMSYEDKQRQALFSVIAVNWRFLQVR
jgi:hypothetical protein